MTKTKDLKVKDIQVEGIEPPKPAKDFLPEYYETLGDGSMTFLGIETGFKSLDMATLGLSGVIVLGGKAGQGKTTLALQLSYMACERSTPVIIYSLEMPRRAVFTKILNRLSRVRYGDILLRGKPYLTNKGEAKNPLTQDEKARLQEAQYKLEEISKKLYVRTGERGQREINFTTVEEDINLVKAEHNAEKVLVVIDHLQVFSVAEYKDQLDKEGRLITGFKGINERTDATFLLISQQNKLGMTTGGLQSIKGSVDIIYLADIVMNLQAEGKEDKGDIASVDTVSKVKLVIEKNRYNAPKTIDLDFDGIYSNLEERQGI